MKSSQVPFKEDPEKIEFAENILISLRDPVVVIKNFGNEPCEAHNLVIYALQGRLKRNITGDFQFILFKQV